MYRTCIAGLGAALALAICPADVRAQAPDPARNNDFTDQDTSKTTDQEPDTQTDREASAPGEEASDSPAELDEIIVIEGEAPYIPVASRSVRDRDFLLRPRPRPADTLRVVPGMFVNQHAGGGKANQYFLRGFDADHGTDIALSFDGVPLNMVSHGHGQGYIDLNWIIPELVGRVDIFKGPYSPLLGDFATAGAVNMVTHDRVDASSISLTGGSFNTYRALAILGPGKVAGWTPLVAAELYRYDGPFENAENYLRYSTYARVARDLGPMSRLSLAATSYMGYWKGSGQIPLREVVAGRLSRFGSIDPSEGGASERHSAYASYDRHDHDSELHVMGYVARYRLALYSNFSFFAVDPENGDQIKQADDRYYTGLSARYRFRRHFRKIPLDTTLAVQVRGDAADTSLSRTRAREFIAPVIDARIREGSAGLAVQEDVAWTPWLRTITGLRYDLFGFDALERMVEPGGDSGTRAAGLLSPKASLVVTPAARTDLYVNFGAGYHSNDARGVVRDADPVTPLARALGYEIGARSRIADRLDLAGSLWLLDIGSEIVWVGDEGVTEARGPTRRYGAEIEARARILPWLHADLDVTASRARFRDLPEGQNFIPLAPRFTVTGGVSAHHPAGVFGRAGVRSLSDRPLTEDAFLTAEGFTLLDLTIGYRTSRYELMLALDNLLDARWREAQFATTSRLASEPPTTAPPPPGVCPPGTRTETSDTGTFAGCEDVHFTPGAPFNVMLTARAFF
jgi:outer membrane receptor protein involved in Fe transport